MALFTVQKYTHNKHLQGSQITTSFLFVRGASGFPLLTVFAKFIQTETKLNKTLSAFLLRLSPLKVDNTLHSSHAARSWMIFIPGIYYIICFMSLKLSEELKF